jgi:4-hydroxy-4-methyl-2-oxoglutarate aldolase
MLHLAVAEAQPGDVIIANTGSYVLTGAWGEVLTVAAQSRGILGLVIDGAVRDIVAIEGLRFPVFSRGLAIASCTKERAGKLNEPLQIGGSVVWPGDLVFGDNDGVVIVPADRIEEVYEAALARQKAESTLISKLRKGHTTVELLGLPDVRKES